MVGSTGSRGCEVMRVQGYAHVVGDPRGVSKAEDDPVRTSEEERNRS